MVKCPKCEAFLLDVNIDAVTARNAASGQAFKALAYSCPACSGFLSVAIDPVALKSDIVQSIALAINDLKQRLD
jgi:hypothetical protein